MNANKPVTFAVALLAGLVASAARSAPSETLKPLLQEALPDIPGKKLTAVQVIFPPGAKSIPHRHGSAFLYAYVLAGQIRSQIEGQPPHIYRTGDSWTEKPGDHHVVAENVSSRQSARLLVVFVSNTGDALKTDDPAKEP